MSKYWNSKVKELEPYVPGEQPKDKKYIKLNTNENPYPPSKKVLESIKKAVNADLRLYPDPLCSDLIKTISNYYNIKEDEVFIGNGSDEVLAFSFMAFFDKDRHILFPNITYSFYEVYGQLCGLNCKKVKLDDEFNIPVEKFLCENGGIITPNPNAPTTKILSIEEIEIIIKNNEDSVVIIDEAYIDFGGESAVKLIGKYKNLLVIQTLSKSRNLAGLRVGFAMGNKDLIDGLNRIKNSINSYTVDRLAIMGAIEAFKDEQYFRECCEKIINTREWVTEELRKLNFKVIDSKANFLFASNSDINAADLFGKLKDNGILVRYFNKADIDNYLRISIGTDDEMNSLINMLKLILNNKNL